MNIFNTRLCSISKSFADFSYFRLDLINTFHAHLSMKNNFGFLVDFVLQQFRSAPKSSFAACNSVSLNRDSCPLEESALFLVFLQVHKKALWIGVNCIKFPIYEKILSLGCLHVTRLHLQGCCGCRLRERLDFLGDFYILLLLCYIWF